MSTADERRAELVAAAVTDDLDDAERAELDALRAADPGVQVEIDELRAVADRFDALLPGTGWRDDLPSPRLEAAVVAAAGPARPATPNRRRLGLVAAAVALVAVGAGGALGVQELRDDGSAQVTAPEGPPGTLGAVEPVQFAADDDPADVDAALVAHTWGTEAVLDVTGLPPGEVYDVVFLDATGAEVSAGAFLGSVVEIHCSMNAAILREDVRALRIQRPDGTVVRSAELPAVAT